MQHFNLDHLIAEAKERSQLDSFSTEYFIPALEKLLYSLEHEAKLNEAGIYSQRERIINLLVNRLRLDHLIKQHPQISQEQISQPLIIIGLPRTGTTLLSRVLSSDPRFYALYWWESRNPGLFHDETPTDPSPRIAAAEEMIAQMLEAVPHLASIHPFDARAHDEEILLLEHTFFSTVPESGAHLPSYQKWLEKQDQTQAYADLKRMLQCLQWQKKQRGEAAQRWVLKTPHHLHFMPTVYETFPDATFIHSHRDPLQTIPSLASMYSTLHELSSEQIDKLNIANTLLNKWSTSLNNCVAFREQLHTQTQFIDVDYKEVVSSPLTVIKHIYATIDMPFNDATQDIIDQWLATNKRENRAQHQYSLEEFGLNEALIDQHFINYKQQFLL